MTRYKSEEAIKKYYKYIDEYNKTHYTRHEIKLKQEEEDKLQAIIKAKKISINQFVIESINDNFKRLKDKNAKK